MITYALIVSLIHRMNALILSKKYINIYIYKTLCLAFICQQ